MDPMDQFVPEALDTIVDPHTLIGSIFHGTVIEPICTDLHNIIRAAITDHNDFCKKAECVSKHLALKLSCLMPCEYCDRNTVLRPCHPICIECICDKIDAKCSGCKTFLTAQKKIIDECRNVLNPNYQQTRQNYIRRLLNQDKNDLDNWCTLCHDYMFPFVPNPYVNQLEHERQGIYLNNCTECNTYGFVRAAMMVELDGVRDIFLCFKCTGHCAICKKNGKDSLQGIIHETYFGPQKFLVCASCVDDHGSTILDKSITQML